MFGAHSDNMHNYQPSYNLQQIQINNNRLQFFSSLFTTNQITYLDPNKVYCIMQTDRYTKIKEELTNSLQNQQNLEKSAYQMNLENIGLNQEVQTYRLELQKIRNNQQKLIKEYEQISNTCKNYQKSLIDFKNKSNQNPPVSYQQYSIKRQKNQARKTYINQECQTEILLSSQESVNSENIKGNDNAHHQVEVAEQRLYQLLNIQMYKFQQQFQNKICELQEAKLNIGKWQAQNTLLREENDNLRQKIVERDMEEQKLKIWKENIYGFVSRVQNSITNPASKQPLKPFEEQSNEEVHRLRQEVLELRGKIVEMRNKVKRIDEVMEVQGEINDDGAIGMLVRTAQKLKQLVKGMIMEVEQI